jgi:hypothetical protein
MPVVVRIPAEELLGDLVALRAAIRAADPDGEERLSHTERRLRKALGPAVPKQAAARALGISLTGLDRWIDRGLVPVVRAPGSSRLGLETGPLLELLEEVERLRERGERARLVGAALRRLGRRSPGGGRWIVSAQLAALPRPNQPAWELRAAAASTTPLERLGEVARLSEELTALGACRPSGSDDCGPGEERA